MATTRREIIWIHMLHGFLRGPADFEPLAQALEAPLIIPPTDPDSLNWSLERDIDLDPSVRLRVVAWDIKAGLASESCQNLEGLAERFLQSMEGALAHPDVKSKPKSGSQAGQPAVRHILMGEGLGARLILAGIVQQLRRYDQELHRHRTASRRGKIEPTAPSLPWERVIFLGAHPGIRAPRDREERVLVEQEWAHRFLKGPVEKVREAWFQQVPYISSPRMLENLHSEARAWREGVSSSRLATLAQTVLLGRQEDYREDLKRLGVFGEGVRFLWVAGERDRKYVSILHELQDMEVPGEFWMCPDAGHAVHLDAPADLAEKIRLFLV